MEIIVYVNNCISLSEAMAGKAAHALGGLMLLHRRKKKKKLRTPLAVSCCFIDACVFEVEETKRKAKDVPISARLEGILIDL